MKKLYAMILIMAMLLCGCGGLKEVVRVGALVGPTGMGLIDLVDEENVEMEIYQSPTDAVQKLVSGEIDVACVPSNLAPVLYAKTKGNIQVLTTVCNGVLYLVENDAGVQSVEDLAGKTVFTSGKGGTPEYVLYAILENAGLKPDVDVTVQWMEDHADVAKKVVSTPGAIGLLPEPQVSASGAEIAVDVNAVWKEMTGTELPMGVVVAKKDFVEAHPDDISALLKLVEASIEDVNTCSDGVVEKIVTQGIVPNAEICKKVIPRCSLVYLSPEDSKASLSKLFEILYGYNHASVGGAIPGEDIYYGI